MNITVITKQKLTANAQKKMRKKSKHNTKESYYTRRKEGKRRTNRITTKQKTVRKMAIHI